MSWQYEKLGKFTTSSRLQSHWSSAHLLLMIQQSSFWYDIYAMMNMNIYFII